MSLQTFTIPLTNIPQTFEINLAGINYFLTCKFNDASDGGWVLDFADANQIPILCNLPLTTGVDLLDGLAYLGINGTLGVFTDGDDLAVPTLDNLGVQSNLYFQTDVSDG